MFYSFRNIPLIINNNKFAVSEAEISQEITLSSPYRIDERTSTRNISESPHIGNLKLKYFLTGQDYLKQFIYADENQALTGNLAGFTFAEGYINNYNITCSPNSPVEVSANISFFDKLSGSFNPTTASGFTGTILNLYNASIDNLLGYTTNILNNISQVNFAYNANILPSYKYMDTGIILTQPNRINIEKRIITTEVVSDNTIMDLPLSGEKFGITLTFQNPFNTGINENFGCSGRINYKTISFQANNVHNHSLRISQSHLTNVGGISGVITGANQFNIYSNFHPFTSNDGTLPYVSKIYVGDTLCDTFTVIRNNNYDQITVNVPSGVVDDFLNVYTTKGNFTSNSIINFNYPAITITGVSEVSGAVGNTVYISGTNFYRISTVSFGQQNANFKILSPYLILTSVPAGGTTNKIQLIADKRNKTGLSTNIFFCEPQINTVSPTTGQWKDSLVLGGINFSGTTSVKFNGANAFSFSVLDNTLINIQAPETGAGYPEGNIIIQGTGGSTKSISRYIPFVPIYSYNPISGIFFDNITLNTKVDTGYFCPSGNGYKVRFNNIDTAFYVQNTGALTGQIPFGAQDGYIYIYRPDGISTYNPNGLKFNVVSEPQIYSMTPGVVNQYFYFNPIIIGRNFKFFTNQPYYFGISGRTFSDSQYTTNIISNSGLNGDTMQVINFVITGRTGYYDLLVRNSAGTGKLISGLLVNSGINKAGQCIVNTIGLQVPGSHPGFIVDGSTGTIGALRLTTGNSGSTYILTPKNNNLIDLSTIKTVIDLSPSNGLFPNTVSGSLAFWHKNDILPFYTTDFMNFSGLIFPLFGSGFTGIKNIYVTVPGTNINLACLGIRELELY